MNVIRTDSNKVCAECPKMNEKPTIMDASGTSDAIVSFLLKMSKQMKMKIIKIAPRSTASSFATADDTSFQSDGNMNANSDEVVYVEVERENSSLSAKL